ncbi:MAG: hypothetical protein J6A52_06475 [Bacilli bacterium]|nr:hypothetical protein [Bacilli bacterium]
MDELINKMLKSIKKEQVLFRKIIEKSSIDDFDGIEFLKKEYFRHSQNTISLIEELLDAGFSLDDVYEKIDKIDKDLLGLSLKSLINGQSILHKCLNMPIGDSVKRFASIQSISGEYDVISYDLHVNYLRQNRDLGKKCERNLLDYFIARVISCYALRCYLSDNEELAELFSNPELSFGTVMTKTTVDSWLNDMMSSILKTILKLNVIKTHSSIHGAPVSELVSDELNYKLDLAAIFVQAKKYGIELNLPRDNTLKGYVDESIEIANAYINAKTKDIKRKVFVANS